jgi:hypothetical protein
VLAIEDPKLVNLPAAITRLIKSIDRRARDLVLDQIGFFRDGTSLTEGNYEFPFSEKE